MCRCPICLAGSAYGPSGLVSLEGVLIVRPHEGGISLEHSVDEDTQFVLVGIVTATKVEHVLFALSALSCGLAAYA